MKKTTQLNISVQVVIPSLPNFIRLSDGSMVDVKDLSDDSMTNIALAWRNALVELAQQRRDAFKKKGAN